MSLTVSLHVNDNQRSGLWTQRRIVRPLVRTGHNLAAASTPRLILHGLDEDRQYSSFYRSKYGLRGLRSFFFKVIRSSPQDVRLARFRSIIRSLGQYQSRAERVGIFIKAHKSN